MPPSRLFAVAAFYDKFIGTLMFLSGLISKSRFAPGSYRARTTDRGLTFTTAVRMVTGVHYGTADGRSPTHVAAASRFAVADIGMVNVADLAYYSIALAGNVAKLAAGKTDKGIFAFLSHELSHDAGASCKLCALSGVKLNVVDESTNRNVGERKSVSCDDIRLRSGNDFVAGFYTVRSNDISLLAIFILNKSDICGTVGVVLKSENVGAHSDLVALKVNNTIFGSVAAATMTNGDAAVRVASGMLLHRFEKAAFRGHLGKSRIIDCGHITTTGSSGLVELYSHSVRPPYSMLSKNSMPLESALRVTIAFFQSAVLPT